MQHCNIIELMKNLKKIIEENNFQILKKKVIEPLLEKFRTEIRDKNNINQSPSLEFLAQKSK